MAYIFIHGLGQGPNSWNQVLSDINLKAKVLRPDLLHSFLIRNVTMKIFMRRFVLFANRKQRN